MIDYFQAKIEAPDVYYEYVLPVFAVEMANKGSDRPLLYPCPSGIRVVLCSVQRAPLSGETARFRHSGCYYDERHTLNIGR